MKKIFVISAFLLIPHFGIASEQYRMFGPADQVVKVSQTGDKRVFVVDYPGSKVFHDCGTRLPRMSIQYVDKLDFRTGFIDNMLFFEKELPPLCQPELSIRNGMNHTPLLDGENMVTHIGDRLIPISATAKYESGSYQGHTHSYKTTNYIPVVREFRNGPWARYDSFIQCLRGQTKFLLINGVIHNTKPEALLVEKYGVVPPDAIWSAILLPNGQSIAFLFSNQKTQRRAMSNNIRRYMLTLETLEKALKFDIPHAGKYDKTFMISKLPIDASLQGCSNL